MTYKDYRGTIEDRIAKYSLVNLNNGCQLWTAACDQDGYGMVWYQGRGVRVHRVAWELKYGEIPEGLELDHLCRVRNCLNTDHLEVVTHAENVRRGDRSNYGGKHNKVKTHCPQGHEYNEENTHYGKTSRSCRACHRAKSYNDYWRNKH